MTDLDDISRHPYYYVLETHAHCVVSGRLTISAVHNVLDITLPFDLTMSLILSLIEYKVVAGGAIDYINTWCAGAFNPIEVFGNNENNLRT